jgi:hypothetical protein
MKKILLLIPLIFLVGCAADFGRESPTPEIESSEIQVTEKDSTIADLEYQVWDLTESLNGLQVDYDALQAELTENEIDLLTVQNQSAMFLCENQLENMRYQNIRGAVAILEGWFAVQPEVQELQATHSIQFWDGVDSRIHTLRYISAEDNLSTTSSFLIFFEEAGWKNGLLWMTKQCWLDFPH